MEKLIKLLNEYKGKDEWTIECGVPHNDWYSGYAYEHEELIIISKKYGFIKWLVENEKIDNRKVLEGWNKMSRDVELTKMKEFYEGIEEFTLMILSIQDEPIEFLVSILK